MTEALGLSGQFLRFSASKTTWGARIYGGPELKLVGFVCQNLAVVFSDSTSIRSELAP